MLLFFQSWILGLPDSLTTNYSLSLPLCRSPGSSFLASVFYGIPRDAPLLFFCFKYVTKSRHWVTPLFLNKGLVLFCCFALKRSPGHPSSNLLLQGVVWTLLFCSSGFGEVIGTLLCFLYLEVTIKLIEIPQSLIIHCNYFLPLCRSLRSSFFAPVFWVNFPCHSSSAYLR